MSANLFLRLKQMLPEPSVVVARVLSHDAATDTSMVELPTQQTTESYAAGLETGTRFQARGRIVAVGLMAFVRAGVVESEAPDVPIAEIVIGRIVP